MENLSDPDLLVLIRDDSQKAFAIVVHRHRKELYRQIYRKTGCEETTKDILQEIYISLWKNRATIQIEKSFLPYLSKASQYRVADHYLQLKKTGIVQPLTFEEDHPSQWPVEAEIEAAELENRFENRIKKLQPNVQRVFMLSREKGLTVKEIAIEMSLSEQTVKNYVSLALQALQETLKKEQALFCVAFGILVG